VLPNGVTLIVQEHRASDLVALQLWMRIGGRTEGPGEVGRAHYIEHMLFKGTPTRPPGSIDRFTESVGGQSNAYTSYDYTHYDFVLPAAEMRRGVELLADLATNASFDPVELDRERQVVLEEMRLLQDGAEQFLRRRLYELAYAGHAYGRPILGPPALVEGLTRDQIVAFYRKQFVPANMVVVVVGAVDRAGVRQAVDATFGHLPVGTAAAAPAAAPGALEGVRRVDVPRPERQAYLGMAWRAAPTGSEDIYAVDLLTYILGDGPSSRLNREVREQRRLVSAIDAGYGAWQQAGLVTVTARLEPANLDRAEAAILDVVRRIGEDGVTAAERNRALVTAEASYAFDIETVEGLAKSYGQAETTWTLQDELRYLDRLRRTTPAQIRAAAQRYLDGSYARVRFIPAGGAR
jgi:zinc protease